MLHGGTCPRPAHYRHAPARGTTPARQQPLRAAQQERAGHVDGPLTIVRKDGSRLRGRLIEPRRIHDQRFVLTSTGAPRAYRRMRSQPASWMDVIRGKSAASAPSATRSASTVITAMRVGAAFPHGAGLRPALVCSFRPEPAPRP